MEVALNKRVNFQVRMFFETRQSYPLKILKVDLKVNEIASLIFV